MGFQSHQPVEMKSLSCAELDYQIWLGDRIRSAELKMKSGVEAEMFLLISLEFKIGRDNSHQPSSLRHASAFGRQTVLPSERV